MFLPPPLNYKQSVEPSKDIETIFKNSEGEAEFDRISETETLRDSTILNTQILESNCEYKNEEKLQYHTSSCGSSFSDVDSAMFETNSVSSTNNIDEVADDVERKFFSAINNSDHDALLEILGNSESETLVLKLLLTISYNNDDGYYKHDPDVLSDAQALLGPSLEHLNAIHIACILGDEDIALDLLKFVAQITERLDARITLCEFVRRIWGHGNTVLHLASFLGMSSLVKMLLELGANPNKKNDKGYRPVDCADDDETRSMFHTIYEVPGKAKTFIKMSKSNGETSEPYLSYSEQSSKISTNDILCLESDASNDCKLDITSDAEGEDFKIILNAGKKTDLLSDEKIRTNSFADIKSIQNIQKSISREKKKVRFENGAIILYMCRYSDEQESDLNYFRELLGLNNNAKLNNSRFKIDVNTLYSPQQYQTPLQIACEYGKEKIVHILLDEASAAVNIQDNEGWTPLHSACHEGYLNIVKLLCRAKYCSINIDKNNGEIIFMNRNFFNPPDGPINLELLNDDGKRAEDVIIDDLPDSNVIRKVIEDLRQELWPDKSSLKSIATDVDHYNTLLDSAVYISDTHSETKNNCTSKLSNSVVDEDVEDKKYSDIKVPRINTITRRKSDIIYKGF